MGIQILSTNYTTFLCVILFFTQKQNILVVSLYLLGRSTCSPHHYHPPLVFLNFPQMTIQTSILNQPIPNIGCLTHIHGYCLRLHNLSNRKIYRNEMMYTEKETFFVLMFFQLKIHYFLQKLSHQSVFLSTVYLYLMYQMIYIQNHNL